MAISTSSSFFSFPNLHLNSHTPTQSISFTPNSIRFVKTRVFAVFANAKKMANNNSSTLYEVLGVGVGADTLEVKMAYRRLARILHPDVGSCDSSADEFMKVHSAYTTLVDPEKRAAYDRSLVQWRYKVLSMTGSAGNQSRRWETDQCW